MNKTIREQYVQGMLVFLVKGFQGKISVYYVFVIYFMLESIFTLLVGLV
jgi:hypothetical protein